MLKLNTSSATSRRRLLLGVLLSLCYTCCFSKLFGNDQRFEDRVTKVYSRLSKCLVGLKRRLEYSDSLERHFDDVYKFTAKYRNMPLSQQPLPNEDNRTGNTGRWIENYFIDKFSNRPFKFFYGIVPLFIQWTDCHSFQKKISGRKVDDSVLFAPLLAILRQDVIYLAVSNANYGLRMFRFRFPNVLVLSAAGEGHIPIPLLRGDLDYIPPPPAFKYDISFLGHRNHSKHRLRALDDLEYALKKTKKIKYYIGSRNDWIDEMAATAFNLAPLGFARQTFRYSEVVQIGRIPIYIYQDYPWLPYEGSKASPEAFSLVVRLDGTNKIVDTVKRSSYSSVVKKIEAVRAVRSYYTFRGVIDEIEKFFQDPLGSNGGYLRCRIPPEPAISILDINL